MFQSIIGRGVKSRSEAGANSRSYCRPLLGKSSSGTKRSSAPRCSIRRYLPLGDGRCSAMNSHPDIGARGVVADGFPPLRIISNWRFLDVLDGVSQAIGACLHVEQLRTRRVALVDRRRVEYV